MKACPLWFAWVLPLCLLFSCSQPEPPETEILVEKPTQTPDAARFEVNSIPQSEEDPLLAEWDGGRIYRSQLNKILISRIEGLQASVENKSALQSMIEKEQSDILRSLVNNYVMVNEAHKRGLELTPAEKERLLKQAKSYYETEEAYNQAMQESGRTEEDLLKVMSSIELSKKCQLDQQQIIKESINTETMRNYYQEHIAKFTPPQRTSFNRVVINFGNNRTEAEAKALAEKLHAEVKEKIDEVWLRTTDFSTSELDEEQFERMRDVIQECAKQYSESPEANYNYGFMTLYHSEQYSKQFSDELLQAASTLQRGELSSVIRNYNNQTGQQSFQFILMKENIPANVTSFDSHTVQSMIPNMIMAEEMEAWKQQLMDDYNVKYYEENFDPPKFEFAE